jgi:predicted Zn-dependent peptidase
VNLEKIEPALLATMAEFKKLAGGEELIDEAEFARAREFVSGQTILSVESVESVAERLGLGYVLRGVIETPQQQLAALQKVTKKQVEQLARELFAVGEMRLAVIGPYSDTKLFEQILSTY